MTYSAGKIDELRAESARLAARAVAITEKPQLTAEDRRQFEELLELLYEIEDYSARLQTRNWKP